MAKKRAMTSEHASRVKLAGHKNERDFASLIGGSVNLGTHTDKKDVVDAQHGSHSVKGGTYWQVFLYSRARLKTNTIFQGLGNIANIMIKCIDAYPPQYSSYVKNKIAAKQKLQPHMRKLCTELKNPTMFKAFLEKALFDGGNAEYLSVSLGRAGITEKIFNIFHKDDVVAALADDLIVQNSKARKKGEMDDQKVTFRSTLCGKNIGEIEDRHDSVKHYREMKFRLYAAEVCVILLCTIHGHKNSSQIITHGRACRKFKFGNPYK